jgi:hypothetical protein
MRRLLLLLVATGVAQAQMGVHLGEKLRFQVTWGLMTAGYADMMCLPDGNGAVIRTVAVGNAAIQSMYPVFDTLESRVEMTGFPTRFEKKVHEGSYWANFRTVFNRAANTAVVSGTSKGKGAKPDSTLATSPDVHDLLSAFYAFRRMEYRIGQTSRLNILDNRKFFKDVEINCLRKETITVPAGKFECIVIEPKIHAEALFKAKGSLLIWLTNDSRRVPVRMESKISLGRIRCDLMRVTR